MWQQRYTPGKAEFRDLYDAAPLARGAVGWLERHGVAPGEIVEQAMRDLSKRGRHLPRDKRTRYAERVLLGEFFTRWAEKHKGRDLQWFHRERLHESELQPFQLALMAAGDESAFERLVPRFAKQRIAEQNGMTTGSGVEFTTFVSIHADAITERFLANFDSTRPGAAHKAVRYLQTTAVSYYLVRRTRPVQKDTPNLKRYLERSPRLNPRTVLAFKLAYLPALLTIDDRRCLRGTYGLKGNLQQRMQIQEIAAALGYKNAACLSRKLYRVREWCRRSQLTIPQEGQ